VYSALVAFDSGATGILSANRAAGSRYERFELHGRGISAYLRAPEEAEVWQEGRREPERLSGFELAGSADARLSYGYFAESRHFVDCLLRDERPLTDLTDACRTMRLVAAIESGGKLRGA
jgi:predicted dehydrogenase